MYLRSNIESSRTFLQDKRCQLGFKTLIDDAVFQHNSRPCSLADGDFNHDNLLDIVVINFDTNTIGIFLNNGNELFAPQITNTTGDQSSSMSVVVGDFNNDGYLDISVTNYDLHNIDIFLGYGNGNFTKQSSYSTGLHSNPYAIALNDFNKDVYLDIGVANSGTNTIDIFLD
ncbi:unnamed protein product [Rotaria magnacalcarata]|uniref:VCBS repeat-containing protein n=1 Tax=Rotaria magnacalcarata TaxID=392030 RepID=A0A816LVM6_9BILA|nr:unnamed protein product [Rotaria magnacalcarata]